ncbi:hypothetical protein OH76DRAFT_913596 [Lentinus brumalis]|uniref:Uncharacterized protein n=1 Tax=Lentinus brumalis TaxID=2498619 RepID=A0A371D036_9APHY|nr:hypothetical protein OH76DRAFT_913596 [Polyporus brumalis]
MPVPFALDKAQLIALFVNSLLFGAFSVLYAIASWTLLYRNNRTRQHLTVFAVSTGLWVLSIAYSSLTVHRALKAFSLNARQPDGALVFYSNISSASAVAKDAIYVTTLLLGDGFLTYRLFIVWNRAWWITVVPILLVLGTAASGYGACVELITTFVTLGSSFFFGPPTLPPLLATLYSLPVATNLLLTALIAGRITWTLVGTSKRDVLVVSNWHWEVLETVIESAFISSAGLVALLSTYLVDSNAMYICMEAVQPLIGLNFALIILRVHFRGARQDQAPSALRRPAGVQLPGNISGSAPLRLSLSTSGYTLQRETTSKT